MDTTPNSDDTDEDTSGSIEQPPKGARDAASRRSSPFSRRAAMALLGLGGLGVSTGLASARAPPTGAGKRPWYDWQQDVAANGHGLHELGALSTSVNQTPITDFVGPNLSLDAGGVLGATDTHVDVESGGDMLRADADAINFGPGLSATDDGDGSVTVAAAVDPTSAVTPLTAIVDDFESGSLDHYELSDSSAFSLDSTEVFHGERAARVTTSDPALAISSFETEPGFEYRAWFRRMGDPSQSHAIVFGYQDDENFYSLMIDSGELKLARRVDGHDQTLDSEGVTIGAGARWLQSRIVWSPEGRIFGKIFTTHYSTSDRDYIEATLEVDEFDETFDSGRFGFGLVEDRADDNPVDYVLDYVTRRPL